MSFRRRALAPALALAGLLLVPVERPADARPPRLTPSMSTGGTWALTFSDEFNGTSLDRSNWSNGFGWGPRSRGTYGFCDPANNVVGGGLLTQRIEQRAQGGKPWSVGCINSRDRFSQLYGYWEARIRAAGCRGARGAVWAKPESESFPPALDVVELHGDDRAAAEFGIHWRERGSRQRETGTFSGPDFSADFHVFGVEWTPTETIWYVDGVEHMRTEGGARFMNNRGPFYTMLETQVVRPSSRCGQWAYYSSQYVDYIRVWSRDVVPVPPETSSACRAPAVDTQSLPRLPSGTSEVSGMAASRNYPGRAWLIRDSGAPASLYSYRLADDGTPDVREIPVLGATNDDWEDVAYSVGPDGKGRLWTVESGQGGGRRYIYEILEPDPERDASAVALRRYRYGFPDRVRRNTEASFVFAGHLVLVTKTTPGRVYRFEEPLRTDRVNRPTFVGELSGADRVSVVRASPDHRVLVAASHKTAHVYDIPPPGRELRALTSHVPVESHWLGAGAAVEAGDWFPLGSCGFVLLSENRGGLRLRLTRGDLRP